MNLWFWWDWMIGYSFFLFALLVPARMVDAGWYQKRRSRYEIENGNATFFWVLTVFLFVIFLVLGNIGALGFAGDDYRCNSTWADFSPHFMVPSGECLIVVNGKHIPSTSYNLNNVHVD